MSDVTIATDLDGMSLRAVVAVAVRAAQRSMLHFPPRVQLKRHQKMVDDLHGGLKLATAFIGGAECTMAFLRKITFAANRVGSVADDVRYGPNQLELPCGDVNPAESINYAVASAGRAAMSAYEKQMTGSSDFANVMSYAFEAVRRGASDPHDFAVARRIGAGRSTELGPTLDMTDEGPFGPLLITKHG